MEIETQQYPSYTHYENSDVYSQYNVNTPRYYNLDTDNNTYNSYYTYDTYDNTYDTQQHEKQYELSISPSSFDNNHEIIAGLLVLAIASIHVCSYYLEYSSKNPSNHTSLMILGYTILVPFVLRLSPVWYSYPMQIFVTLMIVLLDWFSLHEDKSRFSEKELCLFGNCRWNARITGHFAHIADTATLSLMLIPFIKSPKLKIISTVGFLVYFLIGVSVIENMTKDGSQSDLRGKNEREKCRQARIMKDHWRGAINDLITCLGILLAWQSFLNCEKKSCSAKSFPLNQFSNLIDVQHSNSGTYAFMFTLAKLLIYDLGSIIVPTYTNYINTSFQHGLIDSKEYDIPDCL